VRLRNGRPPQNGDELLLTAEGYAELEAEHLHLTSVARPAAAARLHQALEFSGDLADNPEYLDASAELDVVEQRIGLLERRLGAARVLQPGEASNEIVSLGSHVVLEDLDDHTREEFLLVSSAESRPGEGRLSNESPVGRSITGHRKGDVVDVQAPHRIRHLRIADAFATTRSTRR
jgi:transcription elongation factor GreA